MVHTHHYRVCVFCIKFSNIWPKCKRGLMNIWFPSPCGLAELLQSLGFVCLHWLHDKGRKSHVVKRPQEGPTVYTHTKVCFTPPLFSTPFTVLCVLCAVKLTKQPSKHLWFLCCGYSVQDANSWRMDIITVRISSRLYITEILLKTAFNRFKDIFQTHTVQVLRPICSSHVLVFLEFIISTHSFLTNNFPMRNRGTRYISVRTLLSQVWN